MRKAAIYIILLLLYASKSFSCDCAFKPSIDSAARNSAYIFSGKLISQTKVTVLMSDTTWAILGSNVTDEPFVIDYIKYTFTVTKRYKDVGKEKTIDVYSPAGLSSCGYQFKKGHTYMIYGDSVIFSQPNGEKILGTRTTTCDRTDMFSKEEGKNICELLRRIR